MKVTHVFHSYYPVLGGMERVVQKIAEEQSRMGHDVHVITSTFGVTEPKEEVVNGVHIHRVKTIKFHYTDLAYPMRYPKQVLEASDLVHVHSQNSLFNITIAKMTKRLGKPLVVDFLALDYLKFHTNPVIRLLGGYYQELVQREATRLADEIITLNERDHRILKEKYGIESTIVPHGIDEKYLKEPKDEKLFRKKYGVYEENIVTYVGRIHLSKGLDIFIKALPTIAREVNNFVAVVAGGGSEAYKKDLLMLARKLRVEDKLRILGYINEKEKISLLDASKVFVFPTRHSGEAYPLVIDEAYARCVPVVATETGALPYKVKHLKTGMLVPPNNPSSLAEAIVTLLKNNDLLTRLRGGIRNIKRSLLTWRQVCEKFDGIYRRAMKLANQGDAP